jgi:hypothetical protein
MPTAIPLMPEPPMAVIAVVDEQVQVRVVTVARHIPPLKKSVFA